MQKYKCHKIVEAGQIDRFDGVMTPEGQLGVVLRGGERVDMPPADYRRLTTMAAASGQHFGGYLIRYADGYLSWSPEDVFLDGYAEIP